MGKQHPNHRRVKIHRSYTVEEAARQLAVHKNTVRQWIKAGLPISDNKRPTLILGGELSAFLQVRRAKNKRPCSPGEVYCVRCRAPKPPAGGFADYSPITEQTGNLVAICPDCEGLMNRRVSLAKLDYVKGEIEVAFPQALKQVSESYKPTLNSDLRQET